MNKNSVENRVRSIVNNKLNEKSTVEYKIQQYNFKKDKDEIVKDVIAMLNSLEAIDKDKFIILGVADTGYLKGVQSEMKDDNEYQDRFNNIRPRPSIETGSVKIEDKIIGYIYIRKDNLDFPYEIENSNGKYSEGASFIRKGSTNERMSKKDREKMILVNYQHTQKFHPFYNQVRTSNMIQDEVNYTSAARRGNDVINPSLNNGKYTIGEGIEKFILKFDVANNNVARVYIDYDEIQIARLKGERELFNKFTSISKYNLDFSSRIAQINYEDIMFIVNKFGKYVILIVDEVLSESHGKERDKIVFQWAILDSDQ